MPSLFKSGDGRPKPKIFANLLMGIFLFITLYYGVINYHETDSFFRIKEADPYAASYVKVSGVIRDDSLNNDGCAMWAITSNRPRMSWYSKCNTLQIKDMVAFEKDFHINFRKSHYSVVRDKLKEKQINQNEAEKFGVILTEIFRTENLSKFYGGDLIVYRITRNNSTEEDYLNLLEK